MKKQILCPIALSLLAAVPLNMSAAVPAYDQAAALVSARADVANWQKYLPDEVYVAHVSIPGTHDAATAHEWASATGPTYSTTQEKTLDEQLSAGIRAFDFRPGMTDGTLYCNHGTDRLKLTLDEAFVKLTSYLDAHPTEFFVIHLFRGNIYRSGEASTGNKILGAKDDAASQSQYNELFNQFFNQKYNDYIVDYTPYLKVSDIRGKMVVFRRDRIDFAHIAKAGNLSNWPGSEEQWSADNYVTATNAADGTVNGRIFATDVSSPDNADELQIELSSMTDLFARNCTQSLPNDVKRQDGIYKPDWSMIFTSGAYDGENTKGYLKNATYTNPHFTSLLRTAQQNGQSGPTGTVFSDWVLTDSHDGYDTKGVELVPAIYENNFYYIKDYILDDELFKNSGGENLWEEGRQYFMRNVATGELLSAGADWGTHAALGKYGIRITPAFDQSNNVYALNTTFTQGGVLNGIGENYFVDNTSPAQFSAKRVGSGYYMFTRGAMALGAVAASNTYADGTTYLVDGVAIDESDPMQWWEVIAVDDYFAEAVAGASRDSGADISYMIRGHRFLPNDGDNPDNGVAGWTVVTNSYSGAFGRQGSSHMVVNGTNAWNDKACLLRCYNDKASTGCGQYTNWSLKKSVAGLPAGVYELSMQITHDNALAGNDKTTYKINGEDVFKSVKATDKTGAADVIALFRGETGAEYVLTRRIVLAGGQAIELDFSKAGTQSATNFFLDNLTLIYYGPEETTVEWSMEGETYDTLILPFDAELPEGYEANITAEADVEDGDGCHVLKLTPQGRTVKANVPYIVKKTAVQAREASVLSFTGVSVNDRDSYTVGALTGTHVDVEASASHYVLAHSIEGSWFSLDAPRTVKAAHAYISNDDTPGFDFAEPVVYIGEDPVSTGIGAVIAPDAPVDVYDISGILVRRGAEASRALDGLDRGIYLLCGDNATIKAVKR